MFAPYGRCVRPQRGLLVALVVALAALMLALATPGLATGPPRATAPARTSALLQSATHDNCQPASVCSPALPPIEPAAASCVVLALFVAAISLVAPSFRTRSRRRVSQRLPSAFRSPVEPPPKLAFASS
jgi:hypothetical protein